MNSSTKKKIRILEIVLYSLFLAISSSNFFSRYFGPLPVRSYTLAILSSIALIATAVVSSRSNLFTARYRVPFITTSLFIFAFTTSDFSIYGFSPFIIILFINHYFFSGKGDIPLWAISGIPLYISIFTTSHKNNLSESDLSVQIPLLAGGIVVLISSILLKKSLKEQAEKELKEEVIKSRQTLLEEQKIAQKESDERKEKRKSEAAELPKSTREQMEKELDDVVYFVDRIFRPHSTTAFVYDTTTPNRKKRVATLYSARSKSLKINIGVQITEGEGIIGEIMSTQQPFISGQLNLYNNDLGYYKSNEEIAFLYGVPIISREGELLGVLSIDFKEKQTFKESHKDALFRFAKIAAALLTNIKMRKQQELNAERFHLFYESSKRFSATNQHKEILESLLQYIRRSGPISRASVAAYFNETKQCRIISVEADNREIIAGYSFAPQGSILKSSIEKKIIEYVSDYSLISANTPLFTVGEQIDSQIRSILVIPMGDFNKSYSLAVVVESHQVGCFANTEYRESLKTLVKNGSTAYEKALLYHKMEELATTDGLTKLCNHRTFQEHLHEGILRSQRYKRPLSLILMDIDHFKNFNDTYGHQIGDLVLQVIAECLQLSVRASDLPARYGGEEFVIILPETDVDDALRLAERVRSAVEERRIDTERGILSVTVSIGVATLGKHAVTQAQLIAAADAAMYHSKSNGRNKATLYEEGMTV